MNASESPARRLALAIALVLMTTSSQAQVVGTHPDGLSLIKVQPYILPNTVLTDSDREMLFCVVNHGLASSFGGNINLFIPLGDDQGDLLDAAGTMDCINAPSGWSCTVTTTPDQAVVTLSPTTRSIFMEQGETVCVDLVDLEISGREGASLLSVQELLGGGPLDRKGAPLVVFKTLDGVIRHDDLSLVMADQHRSDEEVLQAVLDRDGPGSTLDADTLDGLDSSDFLGRNQVAGGELSGSYPVPVIADGVIDAANIIDGEVGTGELADGSVTGPKVADDAISSRHVAANSLRSGDLAANSVHSSEIAPNAVGASEIAADAVGSSEIAINAVGSSEIADSAVRSSEIATGAVGHLEIAASAVRSSEIASDAVGASEVKSSEVQLRVTGGCSTGSFIRSIAADGTVTCATPTNIGITVLTVELAVPLVGVRSHDWVATTGRLLSAGVTGDGGLLRENSPVSSSSWRTSVENALSTNGPPIDNPFPLPDTPTGLFQFRALRTP